MNSQNRVRSHFDKDARRFDAIYERQKPLHQRFVDQVFRRVVVERFRLICALAPPNAPWTLLDVGCGSGRYSVALAHMGAERVLGLDFSARMIELATREAADAGFADRCNFVVSEFLNHPLAETFDVVLAIGYFDYLKDPLPHLLKMVVSCRGRLFASFPKRWEWRAPSRKLRFFLQRGFVRFYSRPEVEKLIAESGLPEDQVSLISLGRDWLLVARTARAAVPAVVAGASSKTASDLAT
jgi:SAM-dependent methyltransferase